MTTLTLAPMLVELDAELGIRSVSLSGTVDDQAMFALYRAAVLHLDVTRHVLIDLSDVEDVSVTSDGVRELAASFKRAGNVCRGRVAFCAPADVVYGMTRMAEAIYGGPAQIRVFRSRAEALRWLGSN